MHVHARTFACRSSEPCSAAPRHLKVARGRAAEGVVISQKIDARASCRARAPVRWRGEFSGHSSAMARALACAVVVWWRGAATPPSGPRRLRPGVAHRLHGSAQERQSGANGVKDLEARGCDASLASGRVRRERALRLAQALRVLLEVVWFSDPSVFRPPGSGRGLPGSAEPIHVLFSSRSMQAISHLSRVGRDVETHVERAMAELGIGVGQAASPPGRL